MTVDPTTAAAIRTYNGVNYFFCNPGCAETFDADPERYASGAGSDTPEAGTVNRLEK
jgi:YHS domain-containing protein